MGATTARRWAPRRTGTASPARRLRRYRRPLSAVLLAAAAGTAVHAAVPGPPGTEVVVVGSDLPAGHVLAAADLATVQVPEAAVPDGALDAAALEGVRLASAVRAGEPVTDVRLSGAGLVGALPPGQVAVPVLLAPQVRPWLAVGQQVRLNASAPGADWAGGTATDPGATGGPGPAVADGTVLDVAPASAAGLLAGTAGTDTGGVTALVQVADRDAARLAGSPGPLAAVLLGSR